MALMNLRKTVVNNIVYFNWPSLLSTTHLMSVASGAYHDDTGAKLTLLISNQMYMAL